MYTPSTPSSTTTCLYEKVFNKMSFLLRYDMMTDQSDAKTADEETGRLTVTDYNANA